MVELLKPKGATLGMTLHEPFSPGSPLVVSKLKEAGIADRCGALHVGDRLLSVNKESLEGKSIVDVYRMLRHCDLNVELKIIPAHNFTPSSPSFSHRVAESEFSFFGGIEHLLCCCMIEGLLPLYVFHCQTISLCVCSDGQTISLYMCSDGQTISLCMCSDSQTISLCMCLMVKL